MPSYDRQGDKVATWLFESGIVDLDTGNEQLDRFEENDEVAELDWGTIFPGRRPSARDLDGKDFESSRRILEESQDDWRDAWRDSWTQDLDQSVVQDIIGGIGSGVKSQGDTADYPWDWDVAAWYQQIHFFGYDWGIFIKESALIRQARYIGLFLDPRIKARVPSSILAKTLLRASLASYFLHEQYHHKVECLGIRLYVVERSDRYTSYWKNVYSPSLGTDDLLEEALANADSYRRQSSKPYSVWLPNDVREASKRALEYGFRAAPPGYRKATHYLDTARFEHGENLLHSMVHESQLKPSRNTADWSFAPRLMQSFFKVNDGIWTVVPLGRYRALPTKCAPVRVGSSREVIKLLERLGYSIVPGGGKGSHVKLTKEGCKPVTVPANRENLSPGVGRNIATAIGLSGLGPLQIAVAGTIPIEQLLRSS